MTKLEALNIVIGAIGVAPVTSYTSSHPAAVNGRVNLSRFNKEIQARGWWFNRDHGILLTPDAVTGKILIPDNTLSIDAVNPILPIARRGMYLYNSDAHSFVFENPILVDTITELEFDDVPVTLQNYIARAAALEFATIEEGDQHKLDRLDRMLFAARSDAMASELRHGDYNSKHQSTTLRVLAGIRPAFRRF